MKTNIPCFSTKNELSVYQYQHYFKIAFIILFSAIIIIFFVGLLFGTIPLHAHDLLNFLVDKMDQDNFVLKLRFEREITAFCCGAMLALGSAIIQGLTRNPIVAPDLAGMTSFACLFIVIAEIFFIKSAVLNEVLGIVGSLIGLILCLSLIKTSESSNRIALVITGVALSFTATAIMQLLILTSPQDIDNYLHFLTGSLYAINGMPVFIVIIMALITIPLGLILSRNFSIFSLDDVSCKSIGVSIAKYRLISYIVAALLIGSSIIGVGNMGFLGVVAPNVARQIVGERPRYLFVLSFLIGGFIYLFADILGRIIISPAEIPVGIMTNMISAPLFLYILSRYYRGQR